MRKLAVFVVSAGLVASLSACATSPSSIAECDYRSPATLISATGEFEFDPEADFPTPLIGESVAFSVLEDGDGEQVIRGGVIDAVVSLYDGESGDPLASQGGPLVAVPFLAPMSGFVYPFTDALQCAKVGERVAVTGTAEELFGPDALGLDPDAPVVIVADVLASYLGKANGADQLAESGLPAIALAPNGQPGFTFPDAAAPTELRTVLLKRGSGPAVEQGDSVVLHFTAVGWQADTVSASSWSGNGIPYVVGVTGADDPATGFPAQVSDELVDVPVGSQVMVVVPGETATVYVIDVLGIE